MFDKMSQLPQHIEKWQIREPVANKAGGKPAAILDEKGGPISFTTSVLRSPFDAAGYNDTEASRVGRRVEADEELVKWSKELDAEILKMCKLHSRKLLFHETMQFRKWLCRSCNRLDRRWFCTSESQ